MNINQSGSNRASKRPRYENNHASPEIRQQQLITQNKKEKLINAIKSNKKTLPEEFNQLVNHHDTDVLCTVIEHRGKDLNEQHINTLIAHNDKSIDAHLLANIAVKMSQEQIHTLFNRPDFIPY